MMSFTTLAVLSLILVVALFGALALFLAAITSELETIGGEAKGYGARASFLSKIRLGLRAIEVETGNIPTQVTQLNATLTSIRDGLVVVDDNFAGVIANVSRQGGAPP
jgi:hypothetical protein